MPPGQGSIPPADGAKTPKPRMSIGFKNKTWSTLKSRATGVASILALFIFLIGAGGIGGYYYNQSKKPATKPKSTTVETLSQYELNKLSSTSNNLGASGQVLSIGADALFRGQANVVGNFTVGGQLNSNGTATLSNVNITGNTVANNLTVNGTLALQNAVNFEGLANFTKGINVTGSASVNSLNASSIAVHNISISGPLTVGHLVTQGPAPTIVANSVGAGGTVSISGNDTAGQINVNTGTGPGTTLATITFRATYGAGVHVQLSPITAAAASAQAYVTRNNGGFQIHANSPSAGSVLSYDYLVTQ